MSIKADVAMEAINQSAALSLPEILHNDYGMPTTDLRIAEHLELPDIIVADEGKKFKLSTRASTAGAIALATVASALTPALASSAAPRAKASSEPVVSTASGLFTPLTSSDVVNVARASLLPDRSIAITELNLTPVTLGALGDCATGTIKTLVDTPSTRQEELCDGSPAIMTPQPNPDTQTKLQSTLNTLGVSVVKSIPGFNLNPQATSNLVATGDSLKATYVCPETRSATPQPSTIEMSPGGRATMVFCPSDKIITTSSVDLNNPKFAAAFSKYKADTIRNKPWGGDRHNRSLYVLAPATPKQQAPRATFKYSPAKASINASYDSGATTAYMDMVGISYEETCAEVKKPGSRIFRKVGQCALHINGLREILGYGYDGFTSAKDSRVRVTITGVGNLCKSDSSRGTKMRLKMRQSFKADPLQQWQHDASGKSNTMKSSTTPFSTPARVVCS